MMAMSAKENNGSKQQMQQELDRLIQEKMTSMLWKV
jgi:hypothetical protein